MNTLKVRGNIGLRMAVRKCVLATIAAFWQILSGDLLLRVKWVKNDGASRSSSAMSVF
jgi:hypothetical protein